MLLSELNPTSGDGFISNSSVVTESSKSTQKIGYCPQFSQLFETLTAREQLTFYGILRGIPKNKIHDKVEEILECLDLNEYADRLSGTYSMGNQRKLQLGISMIGKPDVLILDEPTTGGWHFCIFLKNQKLKILFLSMSVDAGARQSMYDFMQQSMKNTATMLVTHSVEEVDNFCSRVGIMVQGQLECLGSSEQLKSFYGAGYKLEFTVSAAK